MDRATAKSDAPREARPSARDAVVIAAIALVARLAVVAWAAPRFPPAGDGTYYQRIAERIAIGLGYTWLWPDGAVTYAAHYPVGYPAAVGAIYAIVGVHPGAAMVLNAVLGAIAAFAVHRLTARACASRRAAALAGLLVALHPGLVAYTPALMTEGATAALVTCAAAIAAWARDRVPTVRASVSGDDDDMPSLAHIGVGPLAVGLVIGLATLVRPQSILLGPAFALLATLGARAPLRGKALLLAPAIAIAVALVVCAPWTARNCLHMNRCALVSVNGGWNLLIGADTESTGAWSPIKVPVACREVFDEAAKDDCFGREARGYIASHPAAWLALAPKKLAATFDYAGAAGWYLHESNPHAFTDRDKLVLGVVETVFERAVLVLALIAVARRSRASLDPEPRGLRASRLAAAGIGIASVLTVHAWVGYAAFALAACLRGRALTRGPMLVSAAAVTVLATLAVHAAFFGAGRYSLVVFPLLSGVAALVAAPRSPRL